MHEMAAAQAAAMTRPLIEIEAEILAQKRTIGRSIVIIGQALREAKDQLAHGAWGEWLEEKVNFSQSTAENYMRIAEQVGSESALLNLPYTKILALLSVPEESREQFAADNRVEDKSVSEIKKLIRERDEARQHASKAEKKIEEQYAQLDAQKKRNSDLVRSLNKTLEEKQALLSREPDTVTIEKEVIPADYDLIKNQLRSTREMLAETQRELEEASEERDAAMEELEAEKAGGDPLDVVPFCDACAKFMNAVFAAPYAREYFATRSDAELERYESNIALVLDWATKAQAVVGEVRMDRTMGERCFSII